jgi:uncharacterized protein (DUF4415 family)
VAPYRRRASEAASQVLVKTTPAAGPSKGCRGEEVSRAEELSKLNSEADWAKVDATTREDIERQAEADDGLLPEGWENTVVLGIPGPKRGIYLRLDPEVPDWFKGHGRGYQTRINAVLRAFIRAQKQAEHSQKEPK